LDDGGRTDLLRVPKVNRKLTWKEVAAWSGTEGSAGVATRWRAGRRNPERISFVNVAQYEKRPLELMHKFLADRKIHSHIEDASKGGHILLIQRLNSQRRFLLRVRPRTLNRREIEQIETVIAFIDRPRKEKGPPRK
jgi:hypothetical protein